MSEAAVPVEVSSSCKIVPRTRVVSLLSVTPPIPIRATVCIGPPVGDGYGDVLVFFRFLVSITFILPIAMEAEESAALDGGSRR